MHELSLISKVSVELEKIAAQHRASRVISAVIEVGHTHHTLEDLRQTFCLFFSSSPLLTDMNLEIRESSALDQEELLLRDVTLEVPDEEDE